MRKIISNAFSLQMLEGDTVVSFTEIPQEEFERIKEDPTVISAVGHPDTAAVLGVPCNRVSISLDKRDILYVAQLTGGRLPEGATTLPEGFSFKYIKVEIF